MAKIYRPHEFAKRIGKSTTTLRRWDREGRLKAKRTPGGHRFYDESDVRQALGMEPPQRKTVVYCRVSGTSVIQLRELKSQEEAMQQFCLSAGIVVDKWISEVGSGMNFKRHKFREIMSEIGRGEISRLIVAHQDRLARFGFDYFEFFASEKGCEILVANQEPLSPQQEMVEDLISIIQTFSERLSGLSNCKSLIEKAIQE